MTPHTQLFHSCLGPLTVLEKLSLQHKPICQLHLFCGFFFFFINLLDTLAGITEHREGLNSNLDLIGLCTSQTAIC